jgi:hypothetical protein
MERIGSFRTDGRATAAPDRGHVPFNAREKAEGIQALLRAIPANPGSAGKMPGSGVTRRTGMGDNLSEIVV